MKVLGRYTLVRPVGAGSTGEVWLATDEKIGQYVALKRMSFGFLAGSDAAQTRQRALQEARLGARLRHHPNVVAIYDVESDQTDMWLAMEYLPSRSLRELVNEAGPRSVGEAATVGRDIASALIAAHQENILHRDVSPGNVLIGGGQVKLADFGIARLVSDAAATKTGVVTGTLAYLAPELANGGRASFASDIFSLGATLYLALEGVSPYGSEDNLAQLFRRMSLGEIRPPLRAGPLAHLLWSMLRPDPRERPDLSTIREQLSQHATRIDGRSAGDQRPAVSADPPPAKKILRTRRAAAVAGGVALVVVLVAAGYAAYGRPAVQPVSQPSPAALALPADRRLLDSCALFPTDALESLGNFQVTRGVYLEGCQATSTTSAVSIYVLPAEVKSPRPAGTEELRGSLTLIHSFAQPTADGQDRCDSTVILPDTGQFSFQANADQAAHVDVCRFSSTVAGAAAWKLDARGVPLSGAVLKNYRLANVDACGLVDAEVVAAGPGLPAGAAYSYGHFGCSWDSGTGKGNLDIAFVLLPRGSHLRDYSTVINGKLAYKREASGTYNKNSCSIFLPVRGTDPVEEVQVVVDTPQPVDQQCAFATGVVNANVIPLLW